MHRSIERCIAPLALTVACLLSAAQLVRAADSSALTSKLPQNVNAVMTIDVTKLLQSPFGQQEQLQSKLLSGYADRPLAIPATARNVVIGAAVDPTDLNAVWQVALIDIANPPRLEPMLKAQGGYLDNVGGKNVAWSRRDIMYVEMDKNTLGVVRPGARQFVAKWLGGKTNVGVSPKLSAALGAAKDADAVFVVDLDGAVCAPAINYALAMGQFPSIEQLEASQPKLAKALASVTDLQIKWHFTDKMEVQWLINFGEDVGVLGAEAKPFVMDVLKSAGWYEPGIENNWDFKAEGKKLTGTGTMEFARFARLVAALGPGDEGPAGGATAQAPGDKPAGDPKSTGGDASANPAAAASMKYYRAFAKSLDSISGKTSPTSNANWLMTQAKQFEQLPVLNVDPDLLAWGQSVTQAYYRAAQELALGQSSAKMAAERIDSPVGYTTDAPNGGGSDTTETRAAYRNAQQQRRNAATAERQAAAQRALDLINPLITSRGKIRADMTQKYGVEF